MSVYLNENDRQILMNLLTRRLISLERKEPALMEGVSEAKAEALPKSQSDHERGDA